MKKLICILTTATILFSSLMVLAKSESNIGENEINLLKAFSIIDETTDFNKVVTRGEFITYVAKIATTDEILPSSAISFFDIEIDDELNKYASLLKEMGVLKGSSDGKFRPDDNITLQEISIIILRLIGYEFMVTDNNYLSVATKKKILKNVTLGDTITMKDALLIIYNTLQCDISDSNSIDGKTIQKATKETYMQKRLNVYVKRGIVTDNSISSLVGKSKIKKNEILVDNTRLINKDNISDILGSYVEAYYVYDNQKDESTVFYLNTYSTKNNKVTYFSKDIQRFSERSYYFYTDEEKTQTKKFALTPKTSIIYNNMAVCTEDNFNESMFVPKNATITLLDNNDDSLYDICFINSYKTVMVNAYDKENKTIYGTKEKEQIDLKNTQNFQIKDKKGNMLNFDDIKKDDVLLVAESLDGEFAEILVNDFSVETTINEIVDNKYFLSSDGAKYEFSKDFVKDDTVFKVSKTCMVYFDFFGNVYSVKSSSMGDWVAGVLVKAQTEANLSGETKIKIFEEDGVMYIYNVAPKITVYTSDNTEKNIKCEEIQSIMGDYTGLIRYKLNSDNCVTHIEIPLEYQPQNEFNDRMFCLLETNDDPNSLNYKNNFPYKSSSQTLGGRVILSQETKIFNIPSDIANDNGYGIDSYSMFSNDSTYICKSYGINSKSVTAKYIAINRDFSLEITDEKSYPLVVDKIIRGINEETDDPCYIIHGYDKYGEVKLYVEDEKVLQNATDPMLTKIKDENGKDTAEIKKYTIHNGDIIRVGKRNNYVEKIELFYDGTDAKLVGSKGFYDETSLNTNPYEIRKNKLLTNAKSYNAALRVMSGYVYNVYEGVITMTTQDLSSFPYDPFSAQKKYFTTSYKINKLPVMKYSGLGKVTFQSMGVGDIKSYKEFGEDCSRFVIFTYSGELVGAVAINGYFD